MAKLLSPDRTGTCVCGVLVADHFDELNSKLLCEKVQHLRRQVTTANVDPERTAAPRLVLLRLVKSERRP